MINNTIYVCGPMTGYPDFNFEEFNRVEKLLSDLDFEVYNPTVHEVREDWTWADYLRHDLRLLLECDKVALLDGWEASKGAQLEVHVAHSLNIPTLPFRHWIK